jgi:hypothetical protein
VAACQRLVAAGTAEDRLVIVWSASSGQVLAALPGHTSPLTSIHFSWVRQRFKDGLLNKFCTLTPRLYRAGTKLHYLEEPEMCHYGLLAKNAPKEVLNKFFLSITKTFKFLLID